MTKPKTVESIKGFDSNLRCRDFQFEVSKTYTHDGYVVVCASGFHAIEGHPLNVFKYYPPAGSRYAIVKQSGSLSRDGDDGKLASTEITIEAEIKIPELVKRAVDWVFSRGVPEGASATGYLGAASATGEQGAASATGYRGAASATGEQGAASATGEQGAASATGRQGAASATGYLGAASAAGDRGAASATGYQGAASATGPQGAASATGYLGAASAAGDRGAASATGDRGAASATGDRGAASATGYQGAASATGDRGAAMASGFNGRVMGTEGNAIFLTHRDNSGTITHVWAGIVGRGGIEANAWYSLGEDGKPFVVSI